MFGERGEIGSCVAIFIKHVSSQAKLRDYLKFYDFVYPYSYNTLQMRTSIEIHLQATRGFVCQRISNNESSSLFPGHSRKADTSDINFSPP